MKSVQIVPKKWSNKGKGFASDAYNLGYKATHPEILWPYSNPSHQYLGNIAIIDNDVSWDDMKSRAELELEGENAPTVATIIDDRPE